jgi:hypothetical protein
MIFIISRSLKNKHNGRGERALVALYSELIRRYKFIDPALAGVHGNPHKKI